MAFAAAPASLVSGLIEAPSSWAATADGARPMTVPPESCQARVRTCMAVVLPVPAGARASWTARPLVAISRTRDCWAALSWSSLAAASAIAMPTRTSLMVRPPVRRADSTMRRSASITAWEVYWRAPARL